MNGPRNYHAKRSQSDTNINCFHLHAESEKRQKDLCRTDTDSQTLKNLWSPKETVWGVGGALRLWDGNRIKFVCYDRCTTINVTE